MDEEHTLAQCREATEEVLQTVFHLIEKLRAPDGNVALFSHGHFGCVLAARWIGSPLIEAQHFTLGTAFSAATRHPEVPVISLWNAASSVNLDPAPDY